MRVEKIIEMLSMKDPNEELAIAWYEKELVEQLTDRKFTDEEWGFMAEDICDNWYLTEYDLEAYVDALDRGL